MSPAETKIAVYKPHSKSTKEYMVVIDDELEYKKWLDGDKSIATSRFTSGLLYASETGSQGKWLTPSSMEISSDFQTLNEDGEPVDEEGKVKKGNKRDQSVAVEDAVNTILTRGHFQSARGFGTGGSEMNPSRGSGLSTGNIGTQGR